MLKACVKCGLVYFSTPHPLCICHGSLRELAITATARSNSYTEAGGEIEGIETSVDIEVN
jgi:hypothetical protein